MIQFQKVARWTCLFVIIALLIGWGAGVGHAEASGSKSVADMLKQPAPASGPTEPAPTETGQIGSTPSGWTLLIQIIFSLGFIVLLIYLLLRFLASRQQGTNGRPGGMKIVSAVGVGSGKTVQVIMIGDALYIVGVGENITLLRHIPASDEMDTILADAEIKPVTGKWEDLISFWKRRGAHQREAVVDEYPASFDDVLGKKWEEVSEDSKLEMWDDEDRRGKGERL